MLLTTCCASFSVRSLTCTSRVSVPAAECTHTYIAAAQQQQRSLCGSYFVIVLYFYLLLFCCCCALALQLILGVASASVYQSARLLLGVLNSAENVCGSVLWCI